jgi:hypothetical protein
MSDKEIVAIMAAIIQGPNKSSKPEDTRNSVDQAVEIFKAVKAKYPDAKPDK